MAKYRVTGPDGSVYEVYAPDSASNDEILRYVQSNVGGGQASADASAAPPTPWEKDGPRSYPAGQDAAEARPSEMTIEQKRALALAAARARLAAANSTAKDGAPIADGRTGYMRGMVNSGLQGLMLNFADEAYGGVGAAIDKLEGNNRSWGDLYAWNRDQFRNEGKDFQESHPYSSAAANVSGSIPLALVPVGAVAKAGTISKAILAGAKVGAEYGGIGGFGSGEGGLENRLHSAFIGSAFGGALGAAIPAVGYLGGKGMQVIRNMTSSQDPKKQAAMLVARALERDNVVGPVETGFSVGSGKPVALADLGGQNVKRLADQVNVQGGTGANKIATFLTERQADQPARIAGDIRRTLSPSTDVYGLSDDLAAQANRNAAPLYAKAYGVGKALPDEVWSNDIASMMNRPSMKQALGRAYRIAAEEGRNPQTLGLDMNAAGDVVFKDKVPTMQTLDYVKRGLDDVLEGFRDKVTGRLVLDESGRAINATRAAFREELKRLNPDYAAALKAYAGPTQQREAINLGRDFTQMDPEQIAKQVSRMSPDELQAFRVGAARKIQDTVDSVKGAGDITKRIFNDSRTKAQIGAAFGEDATNAFGKAMDAERKMFDTNSFVAGNSRTAQRMNDAADVGQQMSEDFLMGGKGRVVRGLIERGIARGRGINDATGAELADMLTQTTPEGRARIIAEILSQRSAAQTTEKNLLRAGTIANLLATQQAANGLAIKK